MQGDDWMSKVYLQVKDVDEFFEELHSKASLKKSYSVLEIIQPMGVTFEEVHKWAITNENWLYILELCIDFCCLHVQDAEVSGELTEEKALYFLHQNHSLTKILREGI